MEGDKGFHVVVIIDQVLPCAGADRGQLGKILKQVGTFHKLAHLRVAAAFVSQADAQQLDLIDALLLKPLLGAAVLVVVNVTGQAEQVLDLGLGDQGAILLHQLFRKINVVFRNDRLCGSGLLLGRAFAGRMIRF